MSVISWISLIGIAVASAALITVLSVYNGIGNVTQSLYSVFDPALIIRPAQGKSFKTSDIAHDALLNLNGVDDVAEIAEENAWLTWHASEAIVTLRGVSNNYGRMTGLDTLIHNGEYVLCDDTAGLHPEGTLCPVGTAFSDCVGKGLWYLLFGSELYYRLGMQHTSSSPVAVNIPRREGRSLGLTPQEAFNTCYAYPAGTFYLQKDIDSRYVVCDIRMARQLLDYAPDEVSALAIDLNPKCRMASVRKEIEALLPDGKYQVLDRAQQQPLYYKIFRSERLGVILILSLIVIIATLNLVASLLLLIMDKRHDIQTFRALGMPASRVRRTFLIEGMLIAWIGTLAGLAVGFIICAVQQQFGIVKMGSNFIVEAFPVAMRWQDFLLTLLLVGLISSLSALFTTLHGMRKV